MFVAAAHRYDIDIRVIVGRLDGDWIVDRIKARPQREIGVDDDGIAFIVAVHRGQHGGFDVGAEVEVFWIVDDVGHTSRHNRYVRVELNQTLTLEDGQHTTFIGHRIAHQHLGTVRQVLQALIVFGVDADRGQQIAAGFDEIVLGITLVLDVDDRVHVRLVLEEVGIDVVVGQRGVRHDVIVDHLDIQLIALSLQDRARLFEHFAMRYGVGRDGDRMVGISSAAAGRQQQCSRQSGRGGHPVCLHNEILFVYQPGGNRLSGSASRVADAVWHNSRKGRAMPL
ncbi:UDP-N-acetylmuramate-alanine ligase [Zymobacter palmae]|uniref:UDP-N-acetylmuramate-alanine ligase n=1 Tax=Zymobacter palmae TaxID=33074 RepID=A0A348HD81_9GAMM|nr:UDP-N-acetylmuramate-alanine ligase [Zymobacter palmae]